MEKQSAKNPILVVTSDKWSRDSYVVFEGEQVIGSCIPDEWVGEKYDEAREHDDEITREQVASEMEDDFFAENTDVDECWPEHHILRAGRDYYIYTDDGMCSWIKDLTDLPTLAKLAIIIEDRTGRPGQDKSGSVLAIAEEMLSRASEIDNLVVVDNPWCIEPMIYTTDEIEDESCWSDGCPDEYTDSETWINEQVEK